MKRQEEMHNQNAQNIIQEQRETREMLVNFMSQAALQKPIATVHPTGIDFQQHFGAKPKIGRPKENLPHLDNQGERNLGVYGESIPIQTQKHLQRPHMQTGKFFCTCKN